MSEVIAMNREVIRYTPVDGAARKCHNCGEAKEGLEKCGGCTLFFYCNRVSPARILDMHENGLMGVCPRY